MWSGNLLFAYIHHSVSYLYCFKYCYTLIKAVKELYSPFIREQQGTIITGTKLSQKESQISIRSMLMELMGPIFNNIVWISQKMTRNQMVLQNTSFYQIWSKNNTSTCNSNNVISDQKGINFNDPYIIIITIKNNNR